MTIRDARERDLARIDEIYAHSVRTSTATFDTEMPQPPARRAWFAQHTPDRFALLVADGGREVLGWATLSAWSDRCAYARTAEVSVYVHHQHQRQGIGRALMGALIERARANGFGVLLSRIADRQPASIALHRAFGFETVGVMRRVGEKFGRVLDVELMDLHLDGPPDG
ncbi:MAG: N-acetyltransferase family protein [Planctomycetota bacterium]